MKPTKAQLLVLGAAKAPAPNPLTHHLISRREQAPTQDRRQRLTAIHRWEPRYRGEYRYLQVLASRARSLDRQIANGVREKKINQLVARLEAKERASAGTLSLKEPEVVAAVLIPSAPVDVEGYQRNPGDMEENVGSRT